MSAQHLDRLFVDRARDYLASEYPAKLRLTLAALPQDKLWWRPNEDSNSVGNLLLHLNGNLRQWIVAGVGGEPFERHRAEEFAARQGAQASALLAPLERTLADRRPHPERADCRSFSGTMRDSGARPYGPRRDLPRDGTLRVSPRTDHPGRENVRTGRRSFLRGCRRTGASAVE